MSQETKKTGLTFNWGTGIALTLVLFAGLMSFMVYQAMQQDFDLVSEDYYAEEIDYQNIIDQKRNALALTEKASLKVTESAVNLQLPADFEGKAKTFSVLMYCEQEADNDFSFEHTETTENSFEVPFTTISEGKWIAKVKLHCDGVDYYFDPEIVF